MAWLALIVGVVLLFIFPKQMGLVIGAILLIVGGFLGYVYLKEHQRNTRRAAVKITIAHDTTVCASDQPLHVSIHNGSDATMTSVSFYFHASKPGHSSNLVPSHARRATSDRILMPGQDYAACYRLPEMSRFVDAKSLNWSPGWVSPVFSDR